MNQRQLIISALEKMGPETARRMVKAFDENTVSNGWATCAWAYAYDSDRPWLLLEDHGCYCAEKIVGDDLMPDISIDPGTVAFVFKVDDTEVNAVIRAFDDAKGTEVSRAELFQLVKQEATGRAVA